MNSQGLFNSIVPMCGFSPLLGPGMVRRALKDAGVEPATAMAGDYLRAVPRLKARMRAYLPEAEVTARALRITQFLEPLCDGATSTMRIRGPVTDSYRPPAPGDSYRPLAPGDSHRPPAPGDSYRPPISTDVFRASPLPAVARRR